MGFLFIREKVESGQKIEVVAFCQKINGGEKVNISR